MPTYSTTMRHQLATARQSVHEVVFKKKKSVKKKQGPKSTKCKKKGLKSQRAFETSSRSLRSELKTQHLTMGPRAASQPRTISMDSQVQQDADLLDEKKEVKKERRRTIHVTTINEDSPIQDASGFDMNFSCIPILYPAELPPFGQLLEVSVDDGTKVALAKISKVNDADKSVEITYEEDGFKELVEKWPDPEVKSLPGTKPYVTVDRQDRTSLHLGTRVRAEAEDDGWVYGTVVSRIVLTGDLTVMFDNTEFEDISWPHEEYEVIDDEDHLHTCLAVEEDAIGTLTIHEFSDDEPESTDETDEDPSRTLKKYWASYSSKKTKITLLPHEGALIRKKIKAEDGKSIYFNGVVTEVDPDKSILSIYFETDTEESVEWPAANMKQVKDDVAILNQLQSVKKNPVRRRSAHMPAKGTRVRVRTNKKDKILNGIVVKSDNSKKILKVALDHSCGGKKTELKFSWPNDRVEIVRRMSKCV